MGELNLIAVGTATVAAFLVSATWYGVLGAPMAALQGGNGATEAHAGAPPPWKIGAAMWDDVPIERTAIHAGDWLIKLLAVTAIVTAWR